MNAAPAKPKALIVGLGRSGLSAARYLLARGWDIVANHRLPIERKAEA